MKNKITDSLSGVTVVDISENAYYKDDAVKLIESLAQKDGVVISEEVSEKIKNSERSYEYDDILNKMDLERDTILINHGWKIIRIKSDRDHVPDEVKTKSILDKCKLLFEFMNEKIVC